mmetsp:Transcript_31642/g.58317  ORF Transcript_31642/g.58317 Transcript_31642/m.58317 type:complete len:250 (-) Transcript_31642:304-1053(-)
MPSPRRQLPPQKEKGRVLQRKEETVAASFQKSSTDAPPPPLPQPTAEPFVLPSFVSAAFVDLPPPPPPLLGPPPLTDPPPPTPENSSGGKCSIFTLSFLRSRLSPYRSAGGLRPTTESAKCPLPPPECNATLVRVSMPARSRNSGGGRESSRAAKESQARTASEERRRAARSRTSGAHDDDDDVPRGLMSVHLQARTVSSTATGRDRARTRLSRRGSATEAGPTGTSSSRSRTVATVLLPPLSSSSLLS